MVTSISMNRQCVACGRFYPIGAMDHNDWCKFCRRDAENKPAEWEVKAANKVVKDLVDALEKCDDQTQARLAVLLLDAFENCGYNIRDKCNE